MSQKKNTLKYTILSAVLLVSLLVVSGCGEKKQTTTFKLPDKQEETEKPTGISEVMEYKGFSYYINYDSEEIIITGYDDSEDDAKIPSQIDNYAVTTIADAAFKNTEVLTVTIPTTVTNMTPLAFEQCPFLTAITVAEGSKSFSAEDGVLYTADGKTLVYYPAGKTDTEFTVPDSVTEICANAFNYSVYLQKVTLGSGVQEVKDYTFFGCLALTELRLGSSVNQITAMAAYGSDLLTTYTVDEDNASFTADSGVLYNVQKTRIITYPVSLSGTKFTVPAGVTEIAAYAFYENNYITDISVPDTLTTIGNNAFKGTALASIVGNTAVTGIGDYAFRDCSALTEFIFSEGVTRIGDGAFYNTGITTINLPNSVTEIGAYAFADCAGVTSITLPANLKEIGAGAFYNLALVQNLTVPAKVTTIGDAAFAGMTSLVSLVIPDSVTDMGESVAYGDTALTNVKIGNGITNVDDNSFYGCTSLASVTLGNSVRKIDDGAFYGCSALSSINIPDSVTLIRDYAFFQCAALPQITLSDNVSKICYGAFAECTALAQVNMPANIKRIKDHAFDGCTALSNVVLPEGFDVDSVDIGEGNDILTAILG